MKIQLAGQHTHQYVFFTCSASDRPLLEMLEHKNQNHCQEYLIFQTTIYCLCSSRYFVLTGTANTKCVVGKIQFTNPIGELRLFKPITVYLYIYFFYLFFYLWEINYICTCWPLLSDPGVSVCELLCGRVQRAVSMLVFPPSHPCSISLSGSAVSRTGRGSAFD